MKYLWNSNAIDIFNRYEDNLLYQKVDFIFTDLPYGTTQCKWDSPLNLNELFKHFWQILKPNGVIALFAQSPFDKKLAMADISHFRYEWIWEKTQATGHLNAKKMPMKAHENILIFYKALPIYNPQKTCGHKRKVATAHHKRNCNTGNAYGKSGNHIDYDATDRYPRSVLKFPSDKQKLNLHETQKPLALCEYMVKTYTNEGDLVLDCCMGSGTIPLAAKNLGREYIGIELNSDIFKIAKQRVEGLI